MIQMGISVIPLLQKNIALTRSYSLSCSTGINQKFCHDKYKFDMLILIPTS